MGNHIVFGSVDWAKDGTCVYLEIEGATSYFQIGPFEQHHPVHESKDFLPGRIPTPVQVACMFPELNALSWETTMRGSFPSIEVHGEASGLKVRLLSVADDMPGATIDERRERSWDSLYRLGEVIRMYFRTA